MEGIISILGSCSIISCIINSEGYYLSEAEFKDILVEIPIPGSVAMKDTSINHLPLVK